MDTDWKHFEIDLSDFEALGLEAERIEPRALQVPDGVELDEIVLLGPESYVTVNVVFRQKS